MTAYRPTNLGVPGIGLHEHFELLRRFGLRFRPKVVIMVIYEGNDLRDPDRFERHLAGDGLGKNWTADGGRSDGYENLVMRHSYSPNFFSASAKLMYARLRGPSLDSGYRVKSSGEEIPLNVANKDRDEVQYSKKLRSGDITS